MLYSFVLINFRNKSLFISYYNIEFEYERTLVETISSMKARNLRRRRRAKFMRAAFIGIIAVLLLLLIILGVTAVVRLVGRATAEEDIEIPVEIYIDGENFSDTESAKAIETLENKYPWNMQVTYKEHSFALENQLEKAFDDIVHTAYSEADAARLEAKQERSFWEKLFKKDNVEEIEPIVLKYDVTFPDVSEYASQVASQLASEWGSPAKDCDLTGYNSETGEFTFSNAESGISIDTDKLTQDIVSAVQAKDFGATIEASEVSVTSDISPSDFKIIATYTTHTTNNANRNINVRLAAEAINGTIVGPGEQFSYNTVVGERTEEKGYKKAPAYSEGQVVQESGGGVCQISSTLYNAVIGAGLRTDERTGHTFEPNYVTPGQDATVSYMEPDFKFTNTSKASICILARYSDRVATVDIYGIPVLEEGVTRHLESEKVSEAGVCQTTNDLSSLFAQYGLAVLEQRGIDLKDIIDFVGDEIADD